MYVKQNKPSEHYYIIGYIYVQSRLDDYSKTIASLHTYIMNPYGVISGWHEDIVKNHTVTQWYVFSNKMFKHV